MPMKYWFAGVIGAIACVAVVAGAQAQKPAPAVTGNGTLIDDLVVANRILDNQGVLDGLVHVSARSLARPDHFFMARDLAPGLVTANDLVEYDLDGNAVDAKAPTGVRERYIHASVYRARADVKSVVHSHMPSVLPFTDSSVALRPMYHMAPFLLTGTPVWDIRTVPGEVGMLVTNNKSGASLADTLGHRTVALMRGHGAVIVGTTVPDAVSNAIFLDVNARVQAQAIALGGKISYLTQADAEAGGASPQPAAPMGAPGYYPRSWGIWKAKAMGEKR